MFLSGTTEGKSGYHGERHDPWRHKLFKWWKEANEERNRLKVAQQHCRLILWSKKDTKGWHKAWLTIQGHT